MIKPLQPGFRPWENHTTALRASEIHPFWWLAPPPSPRRGDFILRYALALFCPVHILHRMCKSVKVGP